MCLNDNFTVFLLLFYTVVNSNIFLVYVNLCNLMGLIKYIYICAESQLFITLHFSARQMHGYV